MATRVYDKQILIGDGVNQKLTANAITAAKTLGADEMGGYWTISGSSALTVVLPDPSAAIGSETLFVTVTGAGAHVLSGSTITFGDDTGNTGNTITFPAVQGSSVVLKSDGVRYLVAAGSGSLTYA